MSDLKIKFGRRLRALRKTKEMTQERLAEAADISVDFLSLMERGVNGPSFETLEKLAKALDVSAKALFEFRELGNE